jgi:hypothetical protein
MNFDAALGLVELLITAMLIGYPVWRMSRRMGFGPDVRPIIVIGCVVFPVLMLWIFAFKEWPVLKEHA